MGKQEGVEVECEPRVTAEIWRTYVGPQLGDTITILLLGIKAQIYLLSLLHSIGNLQLTCKFFSPFFGVFPLQVRFFFLSVFNQFRRFCFEFRFFTHQLWFLGFKRFWGFFVWILVSGFDFVIVLLWSLWESLVFGDYVVGVWGIRACRVFFSWNSCFGFISCLFCREFLWISLISWDYVFGFSGILA